MKYNWTNRYNWKRLRDGIFNLGVVLIGAGILEIIFLGDTAASVGMTLAGFTLILLSGVRDSP